MTAWPRSIQSGEEERHMWTTSVWTQSDPFSFTQSAGVLVYSSDSMDTVVRAVILLASAAVCTSRITDGHCRCVSTTSSVNPKLILGVKSYDPRPYCNKKEVIVTLKDNSEVCLDPDGKFTKAVVATVEKQRKLLAARNKSITTRTTSGSTSTPPTTTRSN